MCSNDDLGCISIKKCSQLNTRGEKSMIKQRIILETWRSNTEAPNVFALRKSQKSFGSIDKLSGRTLPTDSPKALLSLCN